MKGICLFTFFLLSVGAFGQQLAGKVVDKLTGAPIQGVNISTSTLKTVSNKTGDFYLNDFIENDTLAVTHIGYSSRFILLKKQNTTLKIELELSNILLGDLLIMKRNYKKDSINNRKQFSKEFNYKPPTVKDAISGSIPRAIGILVTSLNMKKNKRYKLKQTLLKDEENNFIDSRFNADIVSKLTNLEDEALEDFLIKYRPT